MKKDRVLREKIKQRTRSKNRGTTDRPRLSVFRSNKFIYAQIINDQEGRTLAAANERELSDKLQKETKIEKAKKVGQLLAQKASAGKIKAVTFNRGGYKYHGRIKALAEGARDGGLSF